MSKSNKNREVTIHVDGMHCASCEILIEKKLLKQSGVEFVDASQTTGKVKVIYSEDRPAVEELNTEFNSLGYTFSEKKFHKVKVNPAIGFNSKGQLVVNPKKFTQVLQSIILVIFLVVGFMALERSGIASSVSVTKDSPLPMFTLFGLAAGVSSCAALVGGLLLSMAKQWNEVFIAEDDPLVRTQPHLMFHAGRLVSFAILGAALGAIGEVVEFSLEFTALVTILVAFMMLVLGLQMLEVKWASKLQLTLPKSIGRFAANEQNFQGKYTPFIVGALTFFLPCGFTIVVQTIALSSGSALQGSLIMVAFVLGTLPMLGAISISSIKFNNKPHVTAKFNQIAGILVLFFAIYNFNSQMNVLGMPSLSDINFSSQITEPQETLTVQEGIQTMTIIARGFEYVPTSSTVLTAGVPTELIVDNQGIAGCGTFMAARGLFDNWVSLKPGENIISFTPSSPGRYKLTCTMGMVPPVIVTVV